MKWLKWALLGAGFPVLAAGWLNTASLQSKLSDAALAAAGADWLQVAVNGRDVDLSGEAPTQEAIDAAVTAVAGVRGVRRVAANMTVKPTPPPEPVVLTPPTVESLTTNNVEPEIKGTWPEAATRTLKVTVGDKTYTLGSGNELTSDGSGQWTLKPSAPLADGSYDITVEASDGSATTLRSESPGKLIIDTVAPPAAKFASVAVAASPGEVSGTWPEGEATSLKITLEGKTYELNKDTALSSDSGKWILKLAQPLAEGPHAMAIDTADAAGNIASAQFPAAITVDSQPPKPPTIKSFIGKAPITLTGTWAEGDAKTLRVTVGAHAYEYRVFSGLTTSRGVWALNIPEPLPDGAYDVVVETADAAGNIATGKSSLVIDSQPPAAPTVDRIVSGKIDGLTGTWAEGDAKTLRVVIDGHSYEYRVFNGLTSSRGKWALALPGGLPDGAYDITVETADAAGNVSRDASHDEVVVDTVPPKQPTLDFGRSASPDRLSGTWDEGAASSLAVGVDGHSYQYRVFNGLTSQAGRWALKLPAPLAPGGYEVTVDTADAAGNRSKLAAPLTIAAPEPPTVARLVTNSGTPEIHGRWSNASGATLKVAIAGNDYVLGAANEISADANGNWRLASKHLADGTYDVLVSVTEASGQIATDSSKDELIVDTVAPAAPTVEKIAGNNPSPVIKGTWDEGNAASLEVALDGQVYRLGRDAALLSDGQGHWQLASGKLRDGYYDVTVTTGDAAGNQSKDHSVAEVVVDTSPPLSPTVDPATHMPIAGTWAGGDATALTVGFNGKTYRLGSDKELTASGSNWSLNAEMPGPGVYDVVVSTADGFGNVSQDQSTAEFYVATPVEPVQPPMPMMAAPTVEKYAGNDPAPAIKGTWDERVAKSLTVKIAGQTYVLHKDDALNSDGAGHWILKPAKLPDGYLDVVVETADEIGNLAKDRTVAEIVIDTTPPKAPTVNAGTAMPVTGSWASDDAKSLKVTFNGDAYVLGKNDELSSDGDGWKLAGITPPPGIYDVEVETADAFGNTSHDTSTAELIIAAPPPPKPPEPAPPPPMAAPTVDKYAGNNPNPTITGTWDEAVAKSLSVTVGGKAYVLGNGANLKSDGHGHWSLTPAKLPDGYLDVVVETRDAQGNTARDNTVAEVVVDTLPPQAPTVDAGSGTPVTGTWANTDAKALKVTFNARSYVLGSDQDLTTDGGRWTLQVPTPEPGIYDVEVETADQFGNVSHDASTAEIIIAAPAPQPVAMNAPTIEPYAGNNPAPLLKGTWDEAQAQALTVTIAGVSYVWKTNAELVSNGAGQWTLTPKELPDGTLDVVVETIDRQGNKVSDSTTGEVTIDTAPPAAPTVTSGSQLPITGMWDAKDAVSLKVGFNASSYVLGKNPELTTHGDDWTLAVAAPGAGKYGIMVETADRFGNVSHNSSADAVTVAPPTPPAPEMAAPTIDAQTSLSARPVITGSWSGKAAVTLVVSVAGATYQLGKDDVLTTDAEHWSLRLPVPLKDGVYDVSATTTDASGKSATDATKDELAVDAVGPATPTVDLYASEDSPKSLTGTWAEGDATSLAVTFNGNSATLGSDTGLSSDGRGNWTLQLNGKLEPGSYDVAVTTKDKQGRIARDQTKFEVLVKAKKETEPTPEPVPNPEQVDCETEFAGVLAVNSIHFEIDKAAVKPESRATIAKLAEIAKACPDAQFEVAGHTDNVGSPIYNQALSERRAVAVLKLLASEGVNAMRMTAKGYGEAKPLADNGTIEGRAVNRRIEITVLNKG